MTAIVGGPTTVREAWLVNSCYPARADRALVTECDRLRLRDRRVPLLRHRPSPMAGGDGRGPNRLPEICAGPCQISDKMPTGDPSLTTGLPPKSDMTCALDFEGASATGAGVFDRHTGDTSVKGACGAASCSSAHSWSSNVPKHDRCR